MAGSSPRRTRRWKDGIIVERYIVKTGDTLWGIAKGKLEHGSQWPRLWRYNNRPDVVKVTGRRIPNPDLIYAGQTLLLPVYPNSHLDSRAKARIASAPPVQQGGTLPPSGSGQPLRNKTSPRSLPDIQSPISVKYRLDDLRFPLIVQPGVIMEIRMTGDVLLMTNKSYPAIYVTQRPEIEAQVVSQANHAFGTLVNDARLIYDIKENKLTYRSMLVSQSRIPNLPTTAIGVQMDSTSPLPKLRFEYRFPKIEGSLPLFNYVALDVKIVIELTPMPQQPFGPSPQPLRVPQRTTNWDKVIGTGLLITAGAIVVGTLVEDFFSAGAGTLDDPVSFAASGAAAARGLQMIRGLAVLQAASVPAAITLSFPLQATGPGGTIPSAGER
jgi:hypothetical protein